VDKLFRQILNFGINLKMGKEKGYERKTIYSFAFYFNFYPFLDKPHSRTYTLAEI